MDPVAVPGGGAIGMVDDRLDAIAHPPGGGGEHGAELATTEDAEGSAGEDGGPTGEGRGETGMAHGMSRLTGAVEIVGKHPRRLLLAVHPEGFGETVVVEGEDRHRQERRIRRPCRPDRQGADRDPGRHLHD